MDLSFILSSQRDALVAERDALLDVANPEDFTAEADARVKEINAEVRSLDERIGQAREGETAEAEVRAAAAGGDQRGSVRVVSEPNPVYRRDGQESYFGDLFWAGQPSAPESRSAVERLSRSQETRALSTSATAGGTFAPPLWLVEDFIAYARPGRVTADLMMRETLPGGVASINLPKVATGATVAVVQTQNTAVSNTDITTTSVSSGITTISGQQVVSIQLLRQSGIPFDRVILSDLSLAYAAQLDVQVLSGTGANGQLNGLSTAGTTVTFTTNAPAVVSTTAAASFYNKVIKAIATMNTTRYLPPDAIVMHPTRFAWVLEALDGSNRPLVVPNGPIFNNLAVSGEPVAQGAAGSIAGLPVYLDPNIPTNLGASTNQDQVFVLRTADHWLYETSVENTTWEATYANQNSVLFRTLGFAAFLTRYAGSAQVLDGTGLTAPTL